MKKRNKEGVFTALRTAAISHRLLAVGTILCVAASVVASLIPPLLLAGVIDHLSGGIPLTFAAVLLYFGSLALEGVLSSAQETLLVLFGQKMTHALRSEMSQKLIRLPASTLVAQNPGEVAARFSGDVDTVEALFTSGIISMVADACRILSILAVIAVKNTGLALVLLVVLPLFAVFTRHVQKRMLAAQLENRRAVASVAGQVPETLHNIRTIRALGLEEYMERRYDLRIGESYAAVEKTNFYDAIYSPVVLLLNALVVGIVMLLSASGNPQTLTLFGMSVGTSVAVINYISRIFAPIESLGMEIQTIQSAMAGVKRIDAFLDQPERSIPPERKEAARGDVVLSHVTFGYAEQSVLRDFSMTVKEGEQVMLVGRTGAGKSTVFRLLLGLYRPEAGSVIIGLIVAMIVHFRIPVLRQLCRVYIELFRNTPYLLWIFICVVFCPCPAFFARKMFGLTSVEMKLLFKAALALILFNSSVIAEIVRGGLNGVAKGQFEAGYAQGFNTAEVLLYIVLPQAYRNIVPTLLSQVITTIKDSSYLANVATIELMARIRQALDEGRFEAFYKKYVSILGEKI